MAPSLVIMNLLRTLISTEKTVSEKHTGDAPECTFRQPIWCHVGPLQAFVSTAFLHGATPQQQFPCNN